ATAAARTASGCANDRPGTGGRAQTFIRPSPPTVRSWLFCGWNATPVRGPLCATIWLTSLPSAAFQSTSRLSAWPPGVHAGGQRQHRRRRGGELADELTVGEVGEAHHPVGAGRGDLVAVAGQRQRRHALTVRR